MKLSTQFKHAVMASRLRGVRTYKLAQTGGIPSPVLSGMLHDARKVTLGDKRIVRIGQRLGLRASECFEADATEIAS